jgi:hypothetical protein
MKKIFWITTLIVASCSWSFAQNDIYYDNNNNSDDTYNADPSYNEDQADNSGMSYQTFYDQLSPYGSWINYPGYGYVWVPQADAGFSPYSTSGHWEYTDMGWTWVSDYAWGWATFHYGRWFEDPTYGGWLWMPGYDWAPAWVTWGNYGGYYCWAPVGPRDYVNGHWGYGNYDHHWNCLPREHMGEPGISRYIVSNDVVNHDRHAFESGIAIIKHDNTYGRSVFNAGPKVEDVEKVVNHPITRMTINNTTKPEKTGVHGNAINIYRPQVSKNANQQHAIPTKVVNPSEVPHNNNTNNEHANNNNPGHTEPAHTNNSPVHNNNTNVEPRSQPSHSDWTPPRQSAPAQQRETEPAQHSSGGFIPSERSEPAPSFHSSPSPSFHAAPSGGGGHAGGGGRHR